MKLQVYRGEYATNGTDFEIEYAADYAIVNAESHHPVAGSCPPSGCPPTSPPGIPSLPSLPPGHHFRAAGRCLSVPVRAVGTAAAYKEQQACSSLSREHCSRDSEGAPPYKIIAFPFMQRRMQKVAAIASFRS